MTFRSILSVLAAVLLFSSTGVPAARGQSAADQLASAAKLFSAGAKGSECVYEDAKGEISHCSAMAFPSERTETDIIVRVRIRITHRCQVHKRASLIAGPLSLL